MKVTNNLSENQCASWVTDKLYWKGGDMEIVIGHLSNLSFASLNNK